MFFTTGWCSQHTIDDQSLKHTNSLDNHQQNSLQKLIFIRLQRKINENCDPLPAAARKSVEGVFHHISLTVSQWKSVFC